MKLSKKQHLKNGTEFFYLPREYSGEFGEIAEWIKLPDGLLLKRVDIR